MHVSYLPPSARVAPPPAHGAASLDGEDEVIDIDGPGPWSPPLCRAPPWPQSSAASVGDAAAPPPRDPRVAPQPTTHIPLPDNAAPLQPMLPRLLHRLVADSVLSASQADAVRTLLSDGSELSTARAVNLFLSLWLEADKKGARTSSPCSV